MSKTTNKFSPAVRARAVRMISDHEGDYPSRWLAVVSGTFVEVIFGPDFDISQFTYTVRDSLGATSAGTLTVITISCGGGFPQF